GTLFISDLHLDPGRPHITRAFAEFLERNQSCDRLYILGDLVESWIGDDDDSAFIHELADLLLTFTKAGPQLFLMHGNRDFLIGLTFCQRVGAQLINDPTVIDLYGKPTLLMHGDSLCTDDIDYQAFRVTARSEQWQVAFLDHSLAERRAIAEQLRTKSRESNSNKAQDIMDVNADAVVEALKSYGVQQLIHGHTHRPNRHHYECGTRWVLGDWYDTGWVISSFDGNLTLTDFKISPL
ncbi:UNVERIFIED_CONTAM: hypothetical protein GTU68_009709, partial [Idotea baltica]|nr:hypothetical protein [Idotea baltica]